MDQDKIGRFISLKRKEKKITQKELANMLNVSEKTISKWETGRGLPEVSNMEPLCEKLSITVTELLNGQELPDLNNDSVIKYIEKKEKSRKRQITTTIVISILFIVFSMLVCYFFNTFNKVTIYELYGESEHFFYNDSLLMKSNIKEIFTEGEIEIKNNYIEKENIRLFALYCKEQLIYEESYNNTTSKHIIEEYGTYEYFTDEKLNNIDKWYLELQYEKDGNLFKERINLDNRIIMKNDKMLYLKKKPTSIDKEVINPKIEDNNVKKLKEYITNNGYEEKEKKLYIKKVLKGNLEISIRNESVYVSSFIYVDDNFLVRFNPYTGSYTFINKNSKDFYNYYKKTDNFYCNEVKCNIDDYDDIKNILSSLEKEFLELIS